MAQASRDASDEQTHRRVALVVGNRNYESSPLRNTEADARGMALVLASAGFRVTQLLNADRRAMVEAINRFEDDLRQPAIALFYFAGHGVQAAGRNYLIPIGARIRTERHLDSEAVDLSRILAAMEQNPLNIVILDACRDNPFSRGFRSSARGLAQVDAPVGTLIAFATGPGQVADDGEGAHGLYTGELISTIPMPGLRIEDVFKRVRRAVRQQSGERQTPWESSSLTGEFVFNPVTSIPQSRASATPRPPPEPLTPGALIVRSQRDVAEVWLDGRNVGEVKPGTDLILEGIREGPHDIRAQGRRPNAGTWQRRITLEPGARVELNLEFTTWSASRALPKGAMFELRTAVRPCFTIRVAGFSKCAEPGTRLPVVQESAGQVSLRFPDGQDQWFARSYLESIGAFHAPE